ncbi:MAG: hypothetical protein IT374_03925 [Polyangiaceae bacterium]|nr:hypothetical protein [Polyangiaceae bacterium]
MRPLARLLCLTLPLFALLAAWPRSALAWTEATVLADDVTLRLDRAGAATVDHELSLRVRGTALRALTITGVDADAAPEGDASVTLTAKEGKDDPGAGAQTASTQITQDGNLRLEFAGGLPRGTYKIKVRYRTNLVATGALLRDGPAVRLRWLGPRWANGLDAAKLVLLAPPAPQEPRATGDRADGDLEPSRGDVAVSGAGAFLSNVRRFPDHDELELVRSYVARGEQVAWTAKLDPRALGAVTDPKVMPPPSVNVAAVVRESRLERQVFLAVGLGLAVLVTALTAIKGREVEAIAAARSSRARPLVPLSVPLRAALAGPVFAAGVTLQLFVHPPVLGAVVLVLAMALMAHRAPQARPVARGPGRWLPLSDEDGFRGPGGGARAFFDVGTWTGKLMLVVVAAAVVGAAYATSRVSSYHASLAALDGLALVVLFATGRAAELPPELDGRWLAALAKPLRARRDLRVTALGRFADGASQPDELRLAVTPRRALAGTVGVEIGRAFTAGPGGAIAAPQVLVRVAEGSPAEAALARVEGARWSRGRRGRERVLVVEPALPFDADVLAATLQLTEQLTTPAPRPRPRPMRDTTPAPAEVFC